MWTAVGSLIALGGALFSAWREDRRERTASRDKIKKQMDAAIDAGDWARVAVLAVRLRKLE
jgi:hypothetical protein